MVVCRACALFMTVALCPLVTYSQQVNWQFDHEHDPWINPPWDNFEGRVVAKTFYGDVRGFSVPWHIDDHIWNRQWQRDPPWWTRRINCFLGVPYALPPVGYRRFQRPERPRWGKEWDATYFRPACSQDVSHIRKDIPDFPRANISEDCLYMNIFAPNLTAHDPSVLYPVMVWIHGGDFLHGTSQLLPGHVLATKEVVIVTFNYRLGAFGFLSTEDTHAPGNWGLFDQHAALEFIKGNIRIFRGDPARITLCGEGAGAASVGLHMVSPVSMGKDFYQQAILMSGSDLGLTAYVRPAWRPREYASRLATRLGCPTHHPYDLIDCLRQDKFTWEDIVRVQALVQPHDGDLGVVWAPVQDSGYRVQWPFLPVTPADSRQNHNFEKVPIMIGLNTQDGTEKANSSIRGLAGGIFTETFTRYVNALLNDWRIQSTYLPRAREAVLFQYTYWADPNNVSARGQEFINMVTDLQIGVGIDNVVKVQSLYEPSYLYQFNYKSWNDWLPHWMGVSFSAALPYVFGVPFMNETVLNETQMEPRQYYDYEDRNMSDWMMYMWTNFAKYGEPTPNMTWNITWGPFNPRNLSYLIIDHHSHLGLRYRQDKYGFWSNYFPHAFKQDRYVPTPTPTPSGYEYVIATGCVSVVVILLIAVAIILVILLIFAGESREMQPAAYELPASFSRSQSTSTVLFSSKSSLPQHSVV